MHKLFQNSTQPSPPVTFEPMRLRDIPQIQRLEQLCFPTPWSPETYRRELRSNPHGHYWVVRPRSRWRETAPSILAYGGYWLVGDEAHIVTIATHPEWRRRKLGAWLLINMLEKAREAGAIQATLEVRVGNEAARGLYTTLGFIEVGYRTAYYPPTEPSGEGEDALLLTLFGLDIERVWQDLARKRDAIGAALSL
jgi:ribosomal-protein-alanine N-acetyltransferase